MPKDIIGQRLRVGVNRQDTRDYAGIFIAGSGDTNVAIEKYSATEHVNLILGRARGTPAAPAIVSAGDTLGELEFFAYTNQWHHCAEIHSTACGTPAAGVIPDSDLQFKTTEAGAIDAIRMRVMPTGRVIVGDAGTLTEAQITAQGYGRLWVADSDDHDLLGLQTANNDTTAAKVRFRKSRGTLAAPATVANADEVLSIRASAYTNAWHDDLAGIAADITAAVSAGQAPKTVLRLYANANNAAAVNVVALESTGMRVGDTGYSATFKLHVIGNATAAQMRVQNNVGGATAHVLSLLGGDNSTTGSKFVSFVRPDFTEIGSVSQNAAGTVIYNVTSDERLKTDIQDSPIGLAELLQVRVRSFRYRTDPTNQIVTGFIAQELNTVFPDAVSVGGNAKMCDCDLSDKAGVDEKAGEMVAGNHDADCCSRNPWGVDYGRLSPLIVKALQELAGRVSALEGK